MSLGKTLYDYFSLGPSSLPIVVAQPGKRLRNKTQKNALRALVWLDRRRVPGSYEQLRSLAVVLFVQFQSGLLQAGPPRKPAKTDYSHLLT